MEQVNLLLWSDKVDQFPYILTGSNGKQYLSSKKGEYGGHCKLKIYGRLDCPSAALYLAKGQYTKNRVFFENEETAIAAGYRPCGKCLPKQYKIWKAKQKNDS